MASMLFDLSAEGLEQQTALDRLEARGTLRIALKSAGLEPRGLTVEQLRVLFEKVMPDELEKRGIERASAVCATVFESVSAGASNDAADSTDPDAVFGRLGGD